MEKKKAKELAAVSGATVLGAAPDAKRDDEGDIVMEDEAKTDVQTIKSLLNNNEELDGDVKEQESPFDISSNPVGDLQSPFSSRSQPPTELEEISNPETAVKQLTTNSSQSILPNIPASLTVSSLKLVSKFQCLVVKLLYGDLTSRSYILHLNQKSPIFH